MRIYSFIVTILCILFYSNSFAQNKIRDQLEKANKQIGFFNIYTLGDELLLEVPNNLLGHDFLLAAHVSGLSNTNNKPKLVAGQAAYRPVMFRFIVEDEQLFLLKPNPENVCDIKDEFYPSFTRNNIIPIEETFKIQLFTDTSVIINFTKFLMDDFPYVEPFGNKTKLGRPIPGTGKIVKSKAFSENLEFDVRNSFMDKESFTIIVRKSVILLPEKLMQPRIFDQRMNFFSDEKKVFSYKNQGVETLSYINRFNLQPKEKLIPPKGKLVEPEKPIVFYVDSNFPKDWQESIKKGVEDWLPAFEAIGFKNAIIAKEYPSNNPDFDPDDKRFNCIRFAISEYANSYGIYAPDPRTGEIIQADVLILSEITSLLHKWYFLGTAAVNPEARKKVLSKEVMQKLIRYTVAHEIGHCLGMKHNFRASYAYNTEDLRDPVFTKKHGTTASIMDYTRFNFVAQAGDKSNLLPPYLGEYDFFAIKMAYGLIPEAKTPEEEIPLLREMFLKNETDPRYQFGEYISHDPTSLSDDLGNDIVKSTQYGLKNLRFILLHLREWMQPKGENFEYISGLYNNIFEEYFKFLSQLTDQIGGIKHYYAVENGKLPLIEVVSKIDNLLTIDLIFEELFKNSLILDSEYVHSFAGPQTKNTIKYQIRIVEMLLELGIFENIYNYRNHKDMITAQEYITILTKKVFSPQKEDLYISNIRLGYISGLQDLQRKCKTYYYGIELSLIVERELSHIKELIKTNNLNLSFPE